MADFPGKINTETSSPQPQTRHVQLTSLSPETGFIISIPGILLLVEIVGGLLVWTLVSSATIYVPPASGWVLFVSVTLWIFTLLLFIMLVLSVTEKFSSIPWSLILLVFYGVATVLYLTAFLTTAIEAAQYGGKTHAHNTFAAAAFFGIVTTLAYGASTVFAFMDWKHNGAPTSTVPV